MAGTLYAKLWNAHVVSAQGREAPALNIARTDAIASEGFEKRWAAERDAVA